MALCGLPTVAGESITTWRPRAEHDDATVGGVGLFAGADKGDCESAQGARRDQSRTGGVAYYPPDLDHIDAGAEVIARQIRQQDTIGCTPSNAALDGTYRTIEVKTGERNRSESLTVRMRAGYRADGASQQ